MIARCPACSQAFPVVGSCRISCPFCGVAIEVIVQRLGSPQIPTLDEANVQKLAEQEAEAVLGEARAVALSQKPKEKGKTAWETETGIWRRFSRTLTQVLLQPRIFFSLLSVDRLGGALTFAALVLLPAIGAHAAAIYYLASFPGSIPLPEGVVLTPKVALYVPLILLVFFVFLVTFYQAASSIAAGRRLRMRATIRGASFGFAPMIFGVIPFLGLAVGLLWSLVLHAFALRALYGISRWRAGLIVVAPIVVIVARVVVG